MSEALFTVLRLCRIVARRWAVYALMVVGLLLGYAAAIAISLYVHDELTYDRAIPNSEKVFLISAKYGPEGRPLVDSDRVPAGLARWIKSDLSSVDQVARLDTVEWPMRSERRHVKERFYWADANIFEVLKLPALRGDLKTALIAPGSVVLTRKMAIAYFDTDNALGRVLTTSAGLKLTVTAILKDIPANTHLDREIFASGSTPTGKLYAYDHNRDLLWPNSYTYVTFKTDQPPPDVVAALVDMSRKHWQGPNNPPAGFSLIPLKRLHFLPHGDGEMKPRGHLDSVGALIGVAVAILLLAAINFSGLILTERNERGADMALYSALGARRIDLVGQILREALIVNATSALLGLALVERLLSPLNSVLDISLNLWVHPVGLVLSLLGACLVLTFLGGIAPALIISRTGRTLRAADVQGAAISMRWRGWVVAQLALVIILLIASHTMSRQWAFATRDALSFNGDHVEMIRFAESAETNIAFAQHIRAVPGVLAVAESWGAPTNDYVRPAWIERPGQPMIALTRNSIHPDFFKVYGVELIAGRNLSGTFLEPEAPKEILINLAAVKALGFTTPQAAIGKEIEYETDRTHMRSKIIGVIPDLRLTTLYQPMQPMIFDGFSKYFTQFNVKLAEGNAEDTLRRIEAVWNRDAAGAVPIETRSFPAYLAQQYHDLRQQIFVFNVVSCVAILLSTLGLTGLSIFLTRHQVRELAIRKALGATFADLFMQRLTPFWAPLLLTNLVAWPVAWFCLEAWLRSFDEHVGLLLSSFLGAGLIAVLFSLITVAAYSAIMARGFSASASLRHS